MQPHDTTRHKICSKCGESKPATTEYFQRDKRVSEGLRAACKICRSKEYRAWQASNKEYRTKYNRAYYQANKPKLSQRHRAYYQANKKRLYQYLLEWNKANPERKREHNRAYSKAHADQRRAAIYRRRTIERNAGIHTAKDIQRQYKTQKGKCYYCGVKVGDTYHVDHVVPLSRGGSNGPENLVIACPTCNMSKHNKLPHEWPEGGRLL